MPRVMTADAFWSEFYIRELNQFAKNEGLDVTIIDQPGPKLATKDGRVVRELEEAELKDFLVRWTNELMEGEGHDLRIKVDENGEIHTYRVKPKLVSMNGGATGMFEANEAGQSWHCDGCGQEVVVDNGVDWHSAWAAIRDRLHWTATKDRYGTWLHRCPECRRQAALGPSVLERKMGASR